MECKQAPKHVRLRIATVNETCLFFLLILKTFLLLLLLLPLSPHGGCSLGVPSVENAMLLSVVFR